MANDQLPAINRSGRRSRWRSVENARDRLNQKAGMLMDALIKAAEAGDVKTARWLLEHTADLDDEGREVRPLAEGIDSRGGNRAAGPVAPEGPRILIGVALGGDFARLANAPGQSAAPLPTALSQSVSPADQTRGNGRILDAEPVLDRRAVSE